jgi:hypothetical protein
MTARDYAFMTAHQRSCATMAASTNNIMIRNDG